MTKVYFRELFADVLTDDQCAKVEDIIKDKATLYTDSAEYAEYAEYAINGVTPRILFIIICHVLRQAAADRIIDAARPDLTDDEINILLTEKYINTPLGDYQLENLRLLAEINT